MINSQKLPRVFKEPTGWVIVILVLGFFYVQWPTRVKTVQEPEPFVQTLSNGLTVVWEVEPDQLADADIKAWGHSRKGMSFLLQTAPLTDGFTALVERVALQDKQQVAGAEQEPLKIEKNYAEYSFFDAESRIQTHHWYVVDDQWVKVSVLYKPSMESRVNRAAAFMASVVVPTGL